MILKLIIFILLEVLDLEMLSLLIILIFENSYGLVHHRDIIFIMLVMHWGFIMQELKFSILKILNPTKFVKKIKEMINVAISFISIVYWIIYRIYKILDVLAII